MVHSAAATDGKEFQRCKRSRRQDQFRFWNSNNYDVRSCIRCAATEGHLHGSWIRQRLPANCH